MIEFLGNNWVLITQIISTVMLGFVFFMFRDFEDESARGAWKKPLKLLWWTFSVKWLNTDKSWFNKWKLGEDGTVQEYEPKWYHFGVAPKHKEAFPFSSTLTSAIVS